MRVVVFAGPSLPPKERSADRRLAWSGPAAAGDLLDLLDRPPDRLCLIDGYFDSCPSPWHKELLLLMERGTIVLGAASMGALRAAELDRFGMVGIGAIYRAYRDGRITGDDEVALAHGPAEMGWRPLTIAMVEVRATLLAACRVRLIEGRAARMLKARWHDLHFSERDWDAMAKAGRDFLSAREFAAFRAMHVPLKRIDAALAVEASLAEAVPRLPPVAAPRTCFIEALAQQRGVALDLLDRTDPVS